ncbi:MAG TPA: SelB C-terminal domain-containing protein, partial [Pirellulaceae bacterium]|nr:SelB C-terminal domain-containing protein [Pirellulaceae bacterium]
AEVAELVAGTFLAGAEMIPVSARSGQGLVELRAALRRAADQAERFRIQSDTALPFRLSVDRVFTMSGMGTVVTGTVHSGQLNVGDQIEIQPAGLIARVRQLHNHGREVTQVVKRQRAAINLAGVHHDAIERGFEIAAIGLLQPSRLMTAELTLLPTVSYPLKDRTRLKLHLGTAEIPAIVRLLDRSSLEPGATANVQLYLGRMSVSLWGQPFVIRRESPAETIGGGLVLHPAARPIKKPTPSMLELLNHWGAAQEIKRLEAAIYFADRFTETPHHWARLCGTVPHPEWVDQLIQTGTVQRVPISPEQTVVIHRLTIQQWGERIERWLTKMHKLNPMQGSFPSSQLVQSLDRRKLDADVIQLALDTLLGDGRVERAADRVSLAGAGPKLSKAEQQLLSELAARLQTAGLAVPTVKELQQEHSKMEKSVVPLLNLLVESGVAVRIHAELYLHADTLESAKQRLREVFSRQPRLPMAELREALQTTRKYAVPLAEYLDQIGFTRRSGDLRSLKT